MLLTAPIDGTVIQKYIQENELAYVGNHFTKWQI